jgi:hypothetical protein
MLTDAVRKKAVSSNGRTYYIVVSQGDLRFAKSCSGNATMQLAGAKIGGPKRIPD